MSCRRTKRPRAGQPTRHFETLERRTLLATIEWDGGGDGIEWMDPLNWQGDVLPGPADIALVQSNLPMTMRFSGGTASVMAFYTRRGLEMTGGILEVTNASVNDALTVTGGTLRINGQWGQDNDVSISGATLEGSGRLIFGGLLTLDTVAVHSLDLLANGLPPTVLAGDLMLDQGARLVTGAVAWNAGVITMDDGQIFVRPGATMTMGPGATLIAAQGAGGRIEVRGALESDVDVRLEVMLLSSPTGAIRVLAGTLTLAAGGSFGGTTEVAAGATLAMEEDSNVRQGGAVTGDGTWVVTGATLGVNAPVILAEVHLDTADLNFLHSSQVGALHAQAAGIRSNSGLGVLTITGHGDLADCFLIGRFRVEQGATLGGDFRWAGVITVVGVLSWDGGDRSDLYHPAHMLIEQIGEWRIIGPGLLGARHGGSITNHGTITKTGPGAATLVGVAGGLSGWNLSPLRLRNHGQVNVLSGTLAIDGGGDSDGTMTIAAGAFLQIGRHDFDLLAGGAVDGPGTLRFERLRGSTGRYIAAGSIQTGTLVINGHVEVVGSQITVGALRVLGFGHLDIVGNLNHDGPMTWAGTVGSGYGALVLGANSAASIVQGTVGRPRLDAGLQTHGVVNVATRFDLLGSAYFVVQTEGRLGSTGGQIVAVTGGATFLSLGRVIVDGDLSFRDQRGTPGLLMVLRNQVSVRSGALKLQWEGAYAAEFTIDEGARIDAGGGVNHSFTGSIRGERFRVISGIAAVAGVLDVDNLTVLGGVLSLHTPLAQADSVHLEDGELRLAPLAHLQVNVLFNHLSGTLRFDIGLPSVLPRLVMGASAPLLLAQASELRVAGSTGYTGLPGVWTLASAPTRTGQYGTTHLPTAAAGFEGGISYPDPLILFRILPG